MKLDMIGMMKTVFMVVILAPIIILQLVGVETSAWPTSVVTIWDNLPIILMLVILIGFLGFTEKGQSYVRRARGR